MAVGEYEVSQFISDERAEYDRALTFAVEAVIGSQELGWTVYPPATPERVDHIKQFAPARYTACEALAVRQLAQRGILPPEMQTFNLGDYSSGI